MRRLSSSCVTTEISSLRRSLTYASCDGSYAKNADAAAMINDKVLATIGKVRFHRGG
jgi:hypothetical protein